VLGVGGALLLGALAFASRQQVFYWRDSVHLFSHALEVTKRNWVAHENLGAALADESLAREIEGRLQLYRARRPYREGS
jgi:hypothetical protein